MRRAVAVLVFAGAFSAFSASAAASALTRPSQATAMNDDLANDLKAAGFFRELDPRTAAELEAAVRTDGYAGVFRHPWRILFADDEELAEGTVAEVLESWEPAFCAMNVRPFAARDDSTDRGDHVLDVGDRRVTLVTAAEEQEDVEGRKPGNSWGLAGARLLAEVNRYLTAAGTRERVYSCLGGNDHHALVLTPAMFDVLSTHPAVPARERPYVRNETWPDFGMPP